MNKVLVAVAILLISSTSFAFEEVPGMRYFQNSYSAAQTSTAIRTPTTGSNIAVYGYTFSTDGTTTFTLELTDAQRGGSTANGARHYLAANTTVSFPVGNAPLFTGDVSQALTFSSTGSVNVSITVAYQEVP